jgi:predicted phosphate transport protein (TIGR00153 family)
MSSRLLPKDASFFDLFERHMAKTVEGCKALVDLMADPTDVANKAKRIKEIEHETDEITHACVERLHKTFITPLDRDDIHRLISRMDDIMDFVEAATERFWLYEIKEVRSEAKELARVLVKAAEDLSTAVGCLRSMKDAQTILAKCVEVNRLENEADGILRSAVARLFRDETDTKLIMKWKEVFENLEAASDRTEDVANVLEGVVLEHS